MIKNKLLAIVLCVKKFQGVLINKKFVNKTDSSTSKFALEKDVKNIVSKQNFARWQVILSCLHLEVFLIKEEQNLLIHYLSSEFLTINPSLLSKNPL